MRPEDDGRQMLPIQLDGSLSRSARKYIQYMREPAQIQVCKASSVSSFLLHMQCHLHHEM